MDKLILKQHKLLKILQKKLIKQFIGYHESATCAVHKKCELEAEQNNVKILNQQRSREQSYAQEKTL